MDDGNVELKKFESRIERAFNLGQLWIGKNVSFGNEWPIYDLLKEHKLVQTFDWNKNQKSKETEFIIMLKHNPNGEFKRN